MSAKALQKQLFASIAMLLVAAIAFGSSTYAWFAMRQEVSLTGVKVNVNSDTVFLEMREVTKVNTSDPDNEFKGAVTSNFSGDDPDGKNKTLLYPVAHNELTPNQLNTNTLNTPGNWFYAYSSEIDESQGKNPKGEIAGTASNTKALETGQLKTYVKTLEYEFRLNKNSGLEKAANLYVSSVTIPDGTGIHVIVVGETPAQASDENAAAGVEYASAATNTGTEGNRSSTTQDFDKDHERTVLKSWVDRDSGASSFVGQKIYVYIYYCGEDDNVKSSNFEELSQGFEISLNFAVDAERPTE